jgi:cytidylate kinase
VTRRPPVIAIDGPSGSGKGTIARRVAAALGWHLLDSGALYRLLALAASRRGISLDDADVLADLAENLDVRFGANDDGEELIWLDGEPVRGELRTEEAGRGASTVAALQPVREALLALQRSFLRPPGLVADGRDMRHKQLKDKGIDVSLAALSRDIEDRDRRDSERSVAPLRPAEDARILDSSGQSIEAVTDTVLDWARKMLAEEL